MALLSNAAVLLEKELRTEYRSRELLTTTVVFILLVFMLFSITFHPTGSESQQFGPGLLWMALVSWTLWGQSICNPLYLTLQMILIVVLLAQLVLTDRGFTFRFFSNPVLRYLGRISFSLYLWQELFLVLESPSWGVLRRFPFNVICSIVVAAASYQFIEKPVLDLKSKYQ